MEASVSSNSRNNQPGRMTLIGRDRERVFMHEELTRARLGRGRLVLVGGEAGIGKTTLARAFVEEALDSDMEVLTGNCYDLSTDSPYGPWLDLAVSYGNRLPLVRPPEAFANGQLEGIDNQAQIFSEMLSFLTALSAQTPVMVLIEDLHWADPSSLELLRFLSSRLSSLPVFILVTYRVDELTRQHPLYRQLPAIVRSGGGLRVDLNPLSRNDIEDLIESHYALAMGDRARLVEYLYSHSEGNPFFATELLRALEKKDLLTRRVNGWELGPLDRIVLPALINQVIDARLVHLNDAQRRALTIASAIGHEVSIDLWCAAAGLTNDSLLDVIEQATEAHILESAHDGRSVQFVHALMRETLYESMLPARRRLLHENIANILIERPVVEPNSVAHHLRIAGDPRAADWLVAAGERAQRAYAWITAADLFRSAEESLSVLPGEERRRGWLLLRSARLMRFSDPWGGNTLLARARELAHLCDDQLLMGETYYSGGLLLCYASEFGIGAPSMLDGIEMLERLPEEILKGDRMTSIALADSLPKRPSELDEDFESGVAHHAMTGMHHRRGGAPWWQGSIGITGEAIEVGTAFEAAFEKLEEKGGLIRSGTGHAVHGLSISYAVTGQVNESAAAFIRTREIYRDVDHHGPVGFSHLNEMRMLVFVYQLDDSARRKAMVESTEIALGRAGGAFRVGVSSAIGRLAWQVLNGDWDAAKLLIAETPVAGNSYLHREVIDAETMIAAAQGDLTTAWNGIRAVIPTGTYDGPGTNSLDQRLAFARLAAELSMSAGQLDEARDWLDAHDRWITPDWVIGKADGMALRARLHRVSGDMVRARSMAAHALHLAQNPRQPLALISAHREIGRNALVDKKLDAAEQSLGAALELSLACGAEMERIETLLAFVELRIAQNLSTPATGLIQEIRGWCGPRHAQPALDRCVELERKLHAGPVTHPYGLTAREIEVLRLVALGMTDAAVAERLFISIRTVGQHLRSIYGKLGVSSRSAATRISIESGIS